MKVAANLNEGVPDQCFSVAFKGGLIGYAVTTGLEQQRFILLLMGFNGLAVAAFFGLELKIMVSILPSLFFLWVCDFCEC